MSVDFSNKNLGFICCTSVSYFLFLVIHFLLLFAKMSVHDILKIKEKKTNSSALKV